MSLDTPGFRSNYWAMHSDADDASRWAAALEAARRISSAGQRDDILATASGVLGELLAASAAVVDGEASPAGALRVQVPGRPLALQVERTAARPFDDRDRQLAHFVATVAGAACDHAAESDDSALAGIAHSAQLASLGALAARAAHQVNNPAGVILGYAQLLLSRFADDEHARQALGAIERQARRCAEMGRALSDFAQASCPDYSPCTAAQVLAGLHARLHAPARRRDIALTISAAASTLPTLRAYAPDLEIALGNLGCNALEAGSPGGSVSIAARAEPQDGRDGVLFEVRDNGAGMSAAVRARVFEPLFTTRTGRLGLGATTAAQLVLLYGGRIAIDSTEGAGSTATIWIPS